MTFQLFHHLRPIDIGELVPRDDRIIAFEALHDRVALRQREFFNADDQNLRHFAAFLLRKPFLMYRFCRPLSILLVSVKFWEITMTEIEWLPLSDDDQKKEDENDLHAEYESELTEKQRRRMQYRKERNCGRPGGN